MRSFPLQKALILLCLIAVSASCSRAPQQRLPLLSSQGVVLAFGDSLTHGTGANPTESYPAVLAQLIERPVVVEATPGDQTSDGLAKLPTAIEAHQPELLILCLGGNDFLRKQPEAQIIANLEAMIEIAKGAAVPILLLGVPQPGLFGLKSHPLYEQIAKRHGLLLEESVIPEILSDRDLKADPIHPNARGYRQLAETLATRLRAAGAI